MRKLMMTLLAGALAAGLGAGTRAHADEGAERGTERQSVTTAELPEPVRATVEREAQGGRIEELKKETSKNGRVTYEAEIVKNGQGTEIEVSSDGKVLEREAPHDENGERPNE